MTEEDTRPALTYGRLAQAAGVPILALVAVGCAIAALTFPLVTGRTSITSWFPAVVGALLGADVQVTLGGDGGGGMYVRWGGISLLGVLILALLLRRLPLIAMRGLSRRVVAVGTAMSGGMWLLAMVVVSLFDVGNVAIGARPLAAIFAGAAVWVTAWALPHLSRRTAAARSVVIVAGLTWLLLTAAAAVSGLSMSEVVLASSAAALFGVNYLPTLALWPFGAPLASSIGEVRFLEAAGARPLLWLLPAVLLLAAFWWGRRRPVITTVELFTRGVLVLAAGLAGAGLLAGSLGRVVFSAIADGSLTGVSGDAGILAPPLTVWLPALVLTAAAAVGMYFAAARANGWALPDLLHEGGEASVATQLHGLWRKTVGGALPGLVSVQHAASATASSTGTRTDGWAPPAGAAASETIQDTGPPGTWTGPAPADVPGAARVPSPPIPGVGRPPALWWRRAAAATIDGVILLVPNTLMSTLLVGLLLTGASSQIDRATGAVGPGVFLLLFGWMAGPLLVGTIVNGLYFTLLHASASGQTLGKRLLGIQVRDLDTGGSVSLGRALGRYLVGQLLFAVMVVPGFVNLLSPLWDRWGQAWHDKAVRTVVVDVGGQTGGT